jgi:hypothetical protein
VACSVAHSVREAERCALRAYLRHRATLLEHRAAHIQHMQKGWCSTWVVLRKQPW